MKINEVPQEIKQEVWKRDEFTCRYCGKTTSWEEVEIVYDVSPECGGKLEPTNLLTVCSQCIWEGKTGPIPEKDKKRVLSLIRELISYTNISEDVIFEDDYEQEVLDLNRKVASLKEDIQNLSAALQERDKMAIAYKKKTDRAYQDMENLKRRMDADIKMRVREGTRSVLMSMIASLDNINRAIIEAKKDEKVKEVANVISGLEFIRKGMIDQMNMKGVTMIDPVGEIFDPRIHEAMGSRENKDVFNNTILEVMDVGFLHDDQVLRPAKVMISKGGKKSPKKKEEIEEFELDELEGGEMEEVEKVLELDPWDPKVEVLDDAEDDEEDYVVAKPRKKRSR